MSGNLQVVVGGQFGSEGKGHVTGYLARGHQEPTVVRVAGPNAGHTAYDDQGRKFSLRQVPVAAVTNLDARLVIGAGSEIDPPVLAEEVHHLEEMGIKVGNRLFVDGEATVVTSEHKEQEGHFGGHLTARLGSTGKGIGAARADRAWRKAPRWCDTPENARVEVWSDPVNTEVMLEAQLQRGHTVMIEGTQGYGLGLHAGYYPFCTSSDCRAIDFLAMAGVSPWARCVRTVETWVVLRTYPIRVAGNSGPMENETTWDELGVRSGGHIRPEFTTVTKKERRVGGWDSGLAKRAVLANGGPDTCVALTFFDYWYPEMYEATNPGDLSDAQMAFLLQLEKEIGARILLLGTGPKSMIDLRRL